MKRRFALVLTGALLLLGASLALRGSGQTSPRTLVITGSSTVAPLVVEIVKRFEAQNPGTRIDVQTGGSSRGIADARRGLADVGMVSRALKPTETDLISHSIARDGICLIVHRENPITTLSRAQVIAIYTGKIERWSQVGGADNPITVVHKAAGRSTHELFLKFFDLADSAVRADVVIGDNEAGIKTVAGNPLAVGYVSIGTAEYSAGAGSAIRLLPARGVAASTRSVREGSYPLLRVLNLVTHGEPSGLARDLIAFAQGPDVHDLIASQAFVPMVSPE